MRVPPLILSLVLLATPAYAAEAPSAPASTGAAPPAAGAQIALVSGNVAVYQLGQTDWTRAAVDLPIADGGWLATDAKGRAEIRLGDDALDVGNGTQLNFANLRGKARQVGISFGRIDVRLREAAKNRSDEIDVPGGAVLLTAPGTYDVSVGGDGRPSRIAVFDGSARFTGGGLNQTITPGNALLLQRAGPNLSGSVERAVPDEFVRWARSHDDDRRQVASREQPEPANAATSGSSEPGNAAAPETSAEAAAPTEHHGRVERHRRLVRRHYARVYHRRYYRYGRSYGYAAAPAVPSPFGVIHSLLSILP